MGFRKGETLPKAHFMDEIDEDVLRHFKKALEAEGYADKTIDTRLNIVFFLLKKNGIKARIPADEMPTVIDRQKFRSDHDFGEGRRTTNFTMRDARAPA